MGDGVLIDSAADATAGSTAAPARDRPREPLQGSRYVTEAEMGTSEVPARVEVWK
jgi:hypothetical protein